MTAAATTDARAGASRVAGPAAVGLCLAVGIGRAAATWPHYHVGSFDDDAGYVIVARALAHGHGLTSTLPTGMRLVSTYPPGYSALLAPIARVSATAFGTFRLTSVALFAAVFPLTWWYLRRRGVSELAVTFVLALLALSPVLGTYAVMVMPEVAFVVVLLLTLMALDRWARDRPLAAFGVVAGAAGLMWLKEASVGLVAGFVVWLVLRRMPRKALVLAASSAALFVPVLVARIAEGSDLLGSRYANEFGSAFSGSPVHLVAHALSTYANLAIPQTLVPTSVSPLPTHGAAAVAFGIFGTLTTPLVVLGFVTWVRDHSDAMSVAAPMYLVETLVYPFTNERRLVLILPFVAAWYVLGWVTVVRWVAPRVGSGWSVAWIVPAAALVVLVPQFGRDYLYARGQDSSRPIGSPYMAMLAQLGAPTDVVESDYVWTTTLASGHRAATNAYYATTKLCFGPSIQRNLLGDHAGFVLSAALDNTGAPASPCLQTFAASDPDAVRLLRTDYDQASVFELVGPGTPHPELRDLTAGIRPSGATVVRSPAGPLVAGNPGGRATVATVTRGQAVATWDWGRPARVTQVSVGAAAPAAVSGRLGSIEIQLRSPDGTWTTAATAPGRIGDGGVVPFLLQSKAQVVATALRVVSLSTGPVSLLDVHALGTNLTVQRTLRVRGVDNGDCKRLDTKEHCARTGSGG